MWLFHGFSDHLTSKVFDFHTQGAVSPEIMESEHMSTGTIQFYGSGLFQDAYPNPTVPYATQLAQIQKSPFNRCVLWALHVQTNGDFYYNDTPMVQNGKFVTSTDPTKGVNPDLASLLSQVKSGGNVGKILFSIGPFQSDFDHIVANLASARANFAALKAALPIDGIDFDYEGNYGDQDATNLANLTTLLYKDLGLEVTYCPYTYESFWLSCLAQVYQKNKNVQLVSAFNLQCYDGGTGNDPAQWAAEISSYGSPLGIADPITFIFPGFWVAHAGAKSGMGQCPSEMQSTFTALQPEGVVGGWVWNSGDIFNNESAALCPNQDVTPNGYASAIANGLGLLANR